MVCKYCGTENKDSSVFCMECGARISVGNPLPQQVKQHQYNNKMICCPRCLGTNVTISMIHTPSGYNGRAEIRKKSAPINIANFLGRLFMIFITCGIWLLVPKRSKYNEISKGSIRTQKTKVAVCQSCGNSWNIL